MEDKKGAQDENQGVQRQLQEKGEGATTAEQHKGGLERTEDDVWSQQRWWKRPRTRRRGMGRQIKPDFQQIELCIQSPPPLPSLSSLSPTLPVPPPLSHLSLTLTANQVRTQLKRICVKKAAGPDGISPRPNLLVRACLTSKKKKIKLTQVHVDKTLYYHDTYIPTSQMMSSVTGDSRRFLRTSKL